jgi:splicing factor 3B subunit 3
MLMFVGCNCFRKGAASNELQILTCDPKERIIQLTSRYDPAATCTWVVAPPLGLAILDVPAAPGFILLSWTGGFLLLDLRTPNSPQKAAVYRFQRNLDDEEGSLNSVAASALLQLNSQGRDSACKENSISERESFVDTMDVDRNLSLSSPTITAWSWEPDAPAGLRRSQLALAMDTGEIHIAQFSLESSDGLPGVEVRQRQYKCSPCNVVLWLKGGFLTVFVDMGDGHVLQSMADGTLTCCSQVQNLTPILDFALVDYHGEKQDQMFACCGAGKEGTLRVIRNGISVEKLHTTPPVYQVWMSVIYILYNPYFALSALCSFYKISVASCDIGFGSQGVTGMYVMRMCRKDLYHAFFVMSFVQETRVLSVGLNFVDITDAVGFRSWSSTLACGNIEDGFVAQVCSKEVCVCAPTVAAHPVGINMPLPLCSSWKPPGALFICLGAVAHKMIIVALSQPGLIVMLGTQHSGRAAGQLELFEIQRCLLEAELSCISIPEEENLSSSPLPPSIVGLVEDSPRGQNPPGIEAGKVCVVGTHKPSVMLLSIIHGKNFAPLAVGLIPLMSYMGTTLSGCVPESVRLAQFDRLYILAGLRNGVLLRYEWPSSSPLTGMPLSFLQLTSGKHECGEQFIAKDSSSSRDEAAGKEDSLPVALHLVAVRRIGVSPVSLVSLQDSLRADIVALSDRPWLLQTARHSQRIAYTSISFPPSTHATPVSSFDCPNGILFVADCSLHLVEMEHLKRLNVQRLPVGRTPRRVLYHSESKTLLVMRSDSSGPNRSAASDICCMDPLSGVIHSCFQLEAGETARCMQLWKVGNEQLLLVGTSLTGSNSITTAGEAERYISFGHDVLSAAPITNTGVKGLFMDSVICSLTWHAMLKNPLLESSCIVCKP